MRFIPIKRKELPDVPRKHRRTACNRRLHFMNKTEKIKRFALAAYSGDLSGWELRYTLDNGLTCYYLYDGDDMIATAYMHGSNIKIHESAPGCPEVMV